MASRTHISRRSRKGGDPTLGELWQDFRADYTGARETRFQRQRLGVTRIGRNADFHYRIVGDHLKLMEIARDADRNDLVIGSLFDRAVTNTVQGGFTPDPKTGDRGVDRELKARFEERAEDPDLCDLAGEMDFQQQQNRVLRASLVDGDHFLSPQEDGTLEHIEAHRCRTPTGTSRKNVVLGVMQDENRKRLEYWFTKNDIDPVSSVSLVGDINRYKARETDEFGHTYRNVFHVYNPKRVSQTRGVTAFAPMIEVEGMFEDTVFAQVVKAQASSAIIIFRKKIQQFMGGADANAEPTGEVEQETLSDGSTRQLVGLGPGTEIEGRPGETLEGFAPNIVSADALAFTKFILTLLGLNLGMPLIMVLMDPSDASWSGGRMAIDLAKMGFRENQRMLVRTLHRPLWRFLCCHWMYDDPRLRDLHDKGKVNLFNCHWRLPTWPYIDPFKDANAEKLLVETRLSSRRRVLASRNMDIRDVDRETIRDNAWALREAHREAQRLARELGAPLKPLEIDPRELLTGIQAPNPKLPTAGDTGKPTRNGDSQQGDGQNRDKQAPQNRLTGHPLDAHANGASATNGSMP